MRSEIENRLIAYADLPARIANLRDQLQQAEAEAASIRAISFDVVGKASSPDPHTIESRLAKIESLRYHLKALELEQNVISRNLADLSPNERRCLEVMVIQRRRGGLVDLMDELQYSAPQLYRIRHAALERMRRRLDGI